MIDRHIWANSVDPDQTVPAGSTPFVILSASFGHIILWQNPSVQILGQLQQFFGCPNFHDFYSIVFSFHRHMTIKNI